MKVFIPLLPEEEARFRAFLKDTGRKAGPWVRTLILARSEWHEFGDRQPAKNLAANGSHAGEDSFLVHPGTARRGA